MKKLFILVVSGLLYASATFAQDIYTLDKAHARLSFSAYHMGISFIDGIFEDFDATLVASKEDFSDAKIEMTAKVKSINTEVEMRDEDLRSAAWFDAEKYPTIHFESTSFKKKKGNNYKLAGNITIHGVTKSIVFDVVLNGKAQSPFTQKYSYGFTITGSLNRADFGVGQEDIPTVANEIELRSNVEFVVN